MLETRPRLQLWQAPLAADNLLAEYVACRQAAGYAASDKVRLWGARLFLRRYPDLDSWRTASLEEQLALPRSLKAFVNFLFLKHYVRSTLSYLLTARPMLAKVGKRYTPQIYARFLEVGHRLGYADRVIGHTLNFLFYVVAWSGKPAEALTADELQAFEQAMRAYQPPPGRMCSPRVCSQHLYRVRALLFEAGILPQAARRYCPVPARTPEQLWAGVPQALREVVWRYLDQLRTVRALETVTNNEGYLRRFFAWLAGAHPAVHQLAQITRAQIEAFKVWLHDTPCATGRPYHTATIDGTLSALHCFFQALQEWGWPEAPPRPLVFASDRPRLDQPLPRFLDDAQAAALLVAARASDDLFTRVCVESLLRTGLRKGEFVRLQLDSVVQIGETFWLRAPLGKMHTDRYVPLHPEVKRLLDEWVAHRGNGLQTRDLFVRYGRRVSLGCVDEAVRRAARAAGLEGKVCPHRLRHTLATQAINRGMSLEAIAALLGHRSLTMTLVYARIANHVVREQYFSVCQGLDALYAQAALGDQNPVAPGVKEALPP
ncbi:MAG: tyrosine-type recombinase/integrase [Anaerolineales bacterium]|nr:tyrosine-type recombinase/integrase [Anaerolineales bacterium]